MLQQEKITEEYVHFIALNVIPKAMSMEEIIKASTDDREVRGLRAALKLNRWDMDTVRQFKSVKDELTIGQNNIILCVTRIVLPASRRQRAINIAHESHQGLSKTKALMREKIWFPDIDKLTKDNGPHLAVMNIRTICHCWTLIMSLQTPQWPQGNAEVEHFVQPRGRAIQSAQAEGRAWQQELSDFLLQYRLTPHCNTKVPPTELLLNRTICGKLPMLPKKPIFDRLREACNNDQK